MMLLRFTSRHSDVSQRRSQEPSGIARPERRPAVWLALVLAATVVAGAVALPSCEPGLPQRPSEVPSGAPSEAPSEAPSGIRAKGFTVLLKSAAKGPDRYSRGERVRYAPAAGMCFLSYTLVIRNDQPQKSLFRYDRCNLDIGTKRTEPIFVQMDGASALVDEVEEIAPGAEISRTLVFSYPQEHAPTRLSCNELTIPLP